jgi:hypothetical protein
LVCSILSFFAGRSGRKTEYIKIRQFDTVEMQTNTPSQISEIFVDEEAIVPEDDKNG